MARKPSMGKQKIEIKRIRNENTRQVTVSKRKGGIFKKAHELGTLCGAHVAVIIDSPAGQPYSYINSETVMDRYLSGDTRTPTPPVMPHREARILELNKEYSEAL
ncbi:agamous-like MADS-box protein AGL61 [Papaver somniferum]|uniref:agamous-like MADS-box protein AGL61 n=1 Tax=Papaver somniferum TaxID=3469 RepID=UPI000E70338A|nr:agamous-like MADS-box protein AGL61 [Papaver somniferum]